MKKLIKFIYNFQKKEEIFHSGKITVLQAFSWIIGRTVRNLTILASFVLVGLVSAKTYNAIHPLIVHADPVTIEVPVERRLSDYPILVRICNAESGGRQFRDNGDVVRGKVDPSDVGICQINEAINNDQARKLDYDIFTEKGNEDMAIWMFVNLGTQPWNASRCIAHGWGTKAQCGQ